MNSTPTVASLQHSMSGRYGIGGKVTVISSSVVPRLQLNLVAVEPIGPGEVVVSGTREQLTTGRTWRTIQVGPGLHLKNELIDYVDHSCTPNALFDTDRLALVAIRPLQVDESVTFFYPGAEVELAQPFDCRCGAAECLGHVKGAFYLTPAQMRWALARGYCTPFIRNEFERLLIR